MTETEIDLSLAADAAELGSWHFRDGRYHFDSRARALIGSDSADSLREAELLDHIHQSDRSAVQETLHTRLYAGSECDIDFRSGSGRWLRMRGKRPAGRDDAFGVLLDIGKRRMEQQALARFAAIIASSDDAIVGKSLDGVVTDWNEAAERIFGYSAKEILGRPIALLLPPGLEDEESNILHRIERGERVEH